MPYNPISGEGSTCCKRIWLEVGDTTTHGYYLPFMMFDEPLIKALKEHGKFSTTAKELSKQTGLTITNEDVELEFVRLRIQYDFEFWAYSFVKIKPKLSDELIKRGLSGADIPFRLNNGQRKYLKYLYDDFVNGRPIRIILLKCRQWGGSTLTQIFMMWVQLVLHENWNSVICAHIENSAKIVRGMYTKALREYPYALIDGATTRLELSPYEGSTKTRFVKERKCRISIGSSEKPESLRGEDINMAHFSEVGLFCSTDSKKPEDLIQGIVSGIPLLKDTIIVYESTAKGVGNFFHREWLRATKGENGFRPVFIAWYDIETYAKEIDNVEQFIDSMTDKEQAIFRSGATLEQIAWYREKSKEYPDEWRFASEFPSTSVEAFQSTGHPYYNIADIEKLRKYVEPPKFVGNLIANDTHGKNALENISFNENQHGYLKIWEMPDKTTKMSGNRYVVVIDVNRGTSNSADNGIVCVFDRYWMKEGGVPEVVAEWCGHIMMRYFVWAGVQIAKFYNNAYLVIESNTPESAGQGGFEFESVLDEIGSYYNNMYFRSTPQDKVRQGEPTKWGFQTNTSTKLMVCSHQQIVLANDMYIERCQEAVEEYRTFEVKENGKLGAVEGCHDDRHITRAIGVWICYKHLPPPYIIDDTRTYNYKKSIVNESTL